MKKRVLFVCLGNICRSPTAEGIFKTKIEQMNLKDQFSHDSAGTSAYHAGEPCDSRSKAQASEHGVDLSFVRSRQLVEKDFIEFDYILAMDSSNFENIHLQKPDKSPSKIEMMLSYGTSNLKDVPDPYWSKNNGFETVYQLLDESIESFIETVKN